jgi:hypothetical protein
MRNRKAADTAVPHEVTAMSIADPANAGKSCGLIGLRIGDEARALAREKVRPTPASAVRVPRSERRFWCWGTPQLRGSCFGK